MKKINTLTLLICLVHNIYADFWTQKASLPGTARQGAAGFVVGTKAYVGTGYWAQSACLNDFWEWDKTTNVWTQKPSLPGVVRNAGYAFGVGGKGYMGLGTNCGGIISFLDDFYEYDPAVNTWTAKASYGGGDIGYGAGFVINNKIYYGTGTDLSFPAMRKDFWEYNPVTNSWAQKASFAGTSRNSAVGFSIGNFGYLGTGSDSLSISTQDFWQYNPLTNTWLQVASIPGTAKYWAAAFVIGAYGYVGTGGTSSGNSNDFWRYDPNTNSWNQMTNFAGVIRQDAFGFSIGNNGYVGLGSGNGFFNDLWEYTPDSTTEISDLQTENYYLKVTPNPAKDFIKISINKGHQKGINNKITITDLSGKELYVSTLTGNEMVIDVKHFVKGIYNLQLQSYDKVQTIKFVKQ
jgi:N-acetylneuraminic acid mutarotase